jgi:DNA modification methylase
MKNYATKLVDLDTLIPYPDNPKLHDDEQVALLAGRISKEGFNQPIVVDPDMVIVKGHGRRLAATKLGLEKVPVIVLDDLTKAEIKAARLADNAILQRTGYDNEKLKLEIEGLGELDIDLFDVGFDDNFLGTLEVDLDIDLSDDEKEDREEIENAVPDVPEGQNKYDVKKGDVWQLGDHRLMCGDSTSKHDVKALVGNHAPKMIFTSPPYGQQRDYGKEAKELVKDWDLLMSGVFNNIPHDDDTQIFVNLGLIHKDSQWIPYWDNWLALMTKDWRRFGLYVWDQGSGLPGDWNGRLGPSFELIFHFNKKIRRPNKTEEKLANDIARKNTFGLRKKDGTVGKLSSPESTKNTHKIMDSVIRQNRHMANDIARKNHPATFPIGLPEKFLLAYTDINEMVYEPFLGSGTTLIASEKTDRICYGMEIDPNFCSIIIQRFEEYSDKIAVKLN